MTERRRRSAPATRADIERDLLSTAESLVVTERRLDRSRVLGPRAEKTKRNLIDSSAELFRTVGYANTTVADITAHARVSLPTFYQYFSDLDDVIAVIVVEFIKTSIGRGLDRWDVVATGRAGLQRWIESFLRTYVDYADFMELWETAKLTAPGIRTLSDKYSRFYRHLFEQVIREGVDAGLVRDDIAPADLADLLVTTVQYFAYERYVLAKQQPADLATPAGTLTTLLADALGLGPDPPSPVLPSRPLEPGQA